MNLNKDLVIELMQTEIKRLREIIDSKIDVRSIEKDLTEKTLDGSMLPPKFSQKGVSHE